MENARRPSPFAKYLYFLRRDRKTRWLTALAAAALILALAAGTWLTMAALDPYDNRILSGVTLGGVDVGGMTRREAREALTSATENTFSREDMVVQLPDQTLHLTPEETGVTLNVRKAVNDAFRYGRTGTEEEQQAAYARTLSDGHDMSLLPYLTLDQEAITARLNAYAESYNVAYSEPSFALSGEAPVLTEDEFDETAACQTLLITTGTSEITLDVPETLGLILKAYGEHRFLVELPWIAPVRVAAAADPEAIYAQVAVPPVDTSVSLETFALVPGSYGYDFDLTEARQLLDAAAPGETVSISMRYVEPEVLGEEAWFQDLLGSCETPHTADENRNTNLQVACASLDGLILQPGEEFSYNDTLGERTKERGYKPAPAYSGTELVASYGGGICQVSSTLYYCTLLADVEILERINHGYVAKYIQIGTDATVSWWGPDFRFRNNTNFPMMIRAEVSDGYVKVKLLGTDEKDYYVEMESETRGYASSGYYVKTYKLKYDKETGELLSRDYEAASSYRPSYY